jgi:NADPH-dependent glutamate synthase beta subunit-like oxidoreductase
MLLADFDAVFLAIGAQKPKPLDLPVSGISGERTRISAA